VEARIEWLPADRVADLQAFIDAHWRRGHVLARDAELLRWQHRDPARPDRLRVLVAQAPGEGIVAMLGFVAFDACLQGARARGGWMTNWLVVPEWRGRGLGRALVERVLGDDFDLVGALLANSATRHALAPLGFVEVAMARWVRVFSADALERLLGEHASAYSGDAWAAWRRHASMPLAASGDRVRGWDGDAGWDRAWEARFAPRLVAACRDAAHLRRRLLEHPRFAYEVLVASDGAGSALGLAAYRIERVADGDARVMRIVDLLAEPDAAPALASALAAAAVGHDVAFADFECASPASGEALRHAGFELEQALPAALPSRFQPLDVAQRPAVSCVWSADRFDPAALHVTRADSDLDRPN
jgi:GNAT superfamily N-acetyltransferase